MIWIWRFSSNGSEIYFIVNQNSIPTDNAFPSFSCFLFPQKKVFDFYSRKSLESNKQNSLHSKRKNDHLSQSGYLMSPVDRRFSWNRWKQERKSFKHNYTLAQKPWCGTELESRNIVFQLINLYSGYWFTSILICIRNAKEHSFKVGNSICLIISKFR